MALNKRVRIARRFLRSVRIDADLGDASALEGFVCPQSSADVLIMMARHVSETGQGAFTWTGPYGSGKSSLVVALGALLNGDAGLQRQAAKVFGQKLTEEIWNALPTGAKGWRVVPVVGRRDNPVSVIGEAVKKGGLVSRVPRGGWTESNLIAALTETAASKPKMHGGLILFIDEMGKFLEAAAQHGSDLYILQQLAEAASRSNGRFLVVGVLHQAFEEYAHRLSHEMRDEWAKIQGRFMELIVNTAGEEQIDLGVLGQTRDSEATLCISQELSGQVYRPCLPRWRRSIRSEGDTPAQVEVRLVLDTRRQDAEAVNRISGAVDRHAADLATCEQADRADVHTLRPKCNATDLVLSHSRRPNQEIPRSAGKCL